MAETTGSGAPALSGNVPVAGPGASSLSRNVRLVLFGATAAVGFTVDILTKHWVFLWRGNPAPEHEWWIIEPYFGIETSLNDGALFGMGQGFTWVFIALSICAAVGITIWAARGSGGPERLLTFAQGLITGGILGNLIDRLGFDKLPDTPAPYRDAVRDWILFRYGSYTWPNFNIADSLLVCGAAALMWCAWRDGR